MSTTVNHKLNLGGKKLNVKFENYSILQEVDIETRRKLAIEINSLLTNCWGKFPVDFVERHIFGADKMIIARINDECIGLCVMSIREVLGSEIHYIEFLLIAKKFQKLGLGSFLSFMTIKREIMNSLMKLVVGGSLEIFFITPNIRVLSHIAKFASFIYPNPYLSNNDGAIGPADDKTWKIANELLKESDNPGRELERNGLVLKESYAETPWLIYNNDTAPWHSNKKMNVFAKKYLGYHTGMDREFMVRAKINLISLMRYLFIKRL